MTFGEQSGDFSHADWQAFRESRPILDAVENIAQFDYQGRTNLAGRWSQVVDADRVAIKIQASVMDALRLAEFHNADLLDVLLLPDGIRFEYSDGEYGFSWSISDDGTIRLRRRGSSMRRFHDWYKQFMPSASAILRATVAALDDEVSQTTGQFNSINIQALLYRFTVVCHDFVPLGAISLEQAKTVPNFDLMKNLVYRLPNGNGELVDAAPLPREEFNRLDYQVSRTGNIGTSAVDEIYRVEAPSNNAWSGLWFTFVYSGGTAIRPDGRRVPFRADDLITPTANIIAYRDFFATKALSGFLSHLTKGYGFETTTSDLP